MINGAPEVLREFFRATPKIEGTQFRSHGHTDPLFLFQTFSLRIATDVMSANPVILRFSRALMTITAGSPERVVVRRTVGSPRKK